VTVAVIWFLTTWKGSLRSGQGERPGGSIEHAGMQHVTNFEDDFRNSLAQSRLKHVLNSDLSRYFTSRLTSTARGMFSTARGIFSNRFHYQAPTSDQALT